MLASYLQAIVVVMGRSVYGIRSKYNSVLTPQIQDVCMCIMLETVTRPCQ